MGLKDIEIRNSYIGKGHKILDEFLIPTLFQSIAYDRITGYYSIESLLAISQGVEELFNKQGKMRLIIGIHNFPIELIDATLKRDYLIKEISESILSLSDALEKKQLATLAWMIEDGFLEVKAAAVKGNGEGIFHSKTLLFSDGENEIVAVGSANETRNGLGGNIEQLVVLNSWEAPDGVNEFKDYFSNLWNNTIEDTAVSDISEETANMIMDSLGEKYRNPNRTSNKISIQHILADMAKMPSNFFVSGNIPALFIHQERAVIDALSRWPIRVLFADEVGLGKTYEAAATLVYLIKFCNVKRVIILTPKAVLQQWQDELHTNFGLEVWLFDSYSKEYVSINGKKIAMNEKNPIAKGSPDIMLISAQFARGSRNSKNIFELEDAMLPDLLIVDEAHSARISQDISNNKKETLMYKMLESISKKIPHLILATATPMMKSAEEYHAMLKLLGLPKGWDREANYNLSLQLIVNENKPDKSDAYNAARLLLSTMKIMKPDITNLNSKEVECLEELVIKEKTNNKNSISDLLRDNWNIFKNIFIKLHPAHLLTVRNTRRALTEVGYKFPERVLENVDILNSEKIELFYESVNQYLITDCFSIEKACDSEKKINIGFIKVSYQQRIASSLYSCEKSLTRRYEMVKAIFDNMNSEDKRSNEYSTTFDLKDFMEKQYGDDPEYKDEEVIFECSNNEINRYRLKRAASIECATLSSLISQCKKIIASEGDKKIETSINIALDKVNENFEVLIFTRYTDTIYALVNHFKSIRADEEIAYGIYTGEKSVIVNQDKEERCSKLQIKEALSSKKIRILFCTDAASEGLNLQSARVLINVDVPWTHARLEQRIGRIARLGQVANKVFIFNVWYPNSVEARMYKIIQKRLKETNIAIGEFPEVIADKIKNFILEQDIEDDSLKIIKDIRTSCQTKALEQLWANTGKIETVSDKIRSQLIKLCDLTFECVDDGSVKGIKRYKMPDGKIIYLTSRCGMSESISLKSCPWIYKDFKLSGYRICKDILSNYSVITNKNNGVYVKHDDILNIVLKGGDDEQIYTNLKPTMLPNTTALDMSYAIDDNEIEIPIFWPYVEETD